MQISEPFKCFRVAAVLVCMSAAAHAAELLVVESDDCPYCKRFQAEIAVAYPKTAEGKVAPLRLLELGQPMPDEYQSISPATVAPTFILVHENTEVDRIVGYPGDEFFWFRLGQMLDKL